MKLCFLYKLKNCQAPIYLHQLLPPVTASNCYNTRTSILSVVFPFITYIYGTTFFLDSLNERNKLGYDMSWKLVKSILLKEIRQTVHPILEMHRPNALKLLTRI